VSHFAGRIVVFGPHPESAAGWNPVIKNCILWACGKPIKTL